MSAYDRKVKYASERLMDAPVEMELGGGRRNSPYSGRPLPVSGALASRIKAGFGLDASQLSLRESPQVEEMGARAMAQGNSIRFAPGEFRPDTHQGLEVLGHELSHVVQQAKGGVRVNVPGSNVNFDPGLESAGDRMGADFAAGSLSAAGPVSLAGVSAEGAPAQGLFNIGKEKRSKKDKEQSKAHLAQLQAAEKERRKVYKPFLYRDLAATMEKAFANVTYDESRNKAYGDSMFLGGGGLRENPASMKPFKDDLGKESAPFLQNILPQIKEKNANQIQGLSEAFNNGEKLQGNALTAPIAQNFFDEETQAALSVMSSESGSDSLLQAMAAYRGATEGREGKQDFFGNDVNLGEGVLNTLLLNAISPDLFSSIARENDPATRQALLTSHSNAQWMLNNMSAIARDLGYDNIDETVLQDRLANVDNKKGHNASGMTVENYYKYTQLGKQLLSLRTQAGGHSEEPDAVPTTAASDPIPDIGMIGADPIHDTASEAATMGLPEAMEAPDTVSDAMPAPPAAESVAAPAIQGSERRENPRNAIRELMRTSKDHTPDKYALDEAFIRPLVEMLNVEQGKAPTAGRRKPWYKRLFNKAKGAFSNG